MSARPEPHAPVVDAHVLLPAVELTVRGQLLVDLSGHGPVNGIPSR